MKLKRGKRKYQKPEDKTLVMAVPISLRRLIREKTDWDKFIKILTDMAFGGKEVMNYNGQKIIAQPNLDALRMLAEYGWGRPTVEEDSANTEAIKALGKTLSDLVQSNMKQAPDAN
jgi:hypothetical protein